MPTLDSQVHAYERNHLGRPWIGTLYGPPEATGDQMVTALDTVGVDGAVLVSPFSGPTGPLCLWDTVLVDLLAMPDDSSNSVGEPLPTAAEQTSA